MNAMSYRRDDRPDDTRRPRTIMCRDALYRAFEARARELECSVDWLVGEAMKRFLADPTYAVSRPALPRVVPPPPKPNPVPEPSPVLGRRIALRVGDVRALVDRDRFLLGRSAKEAHLPLRDPGVSRQHAIVERTGSEWVIVDMASTNGVHVNGTRVTRAAIRAGDVVEIGPFTIAVEPG